MVRIIKITTVEVIIIIHLNCSRHIMILKPQVNSIITGTATSWAIYFDWICMAPHAISVTTSEKATKWCSMQLQIAHSCTM